LPETVAVPTAVPPLVQLVGAVGCGPKTVNVIVPVAPLVAPESAELIEDAVIAERSWSSCCRSGPAGH
jgi:hypothetical protein